MRVESRRRWLAAAVTMGCLLAGASAVQAQPDHAAADALATEAYDQQTAGKFAEADRLYRESYCANPDPFVIFNLGTVAKAMGNTAGAVGFFKRYLDDAPDGEQAPDARAILRKLGKVAAASADITCAPPPADAPADVTPADTHPLVDVTPPPPPAVLPPPRRTGGTLRWVGLATTVVGAGLLGGGMYFGLAAQHSSDVISNHTGPWTDDLLAQQADGESAEQMQIIFLAAGGAVVVAGIIMTITGGPDDSAHESRTAIRPLSFANGGGLAVAGGF